MVSAALDRDPFIGDAAPCQLAAKASLNIRLIKTAVLQEQPRFGHSSQDLGPSIERWWRVFRRVVEAAERYIPALNRRQRRDGRGVGRGTVTNIVVRHAEHGFAVPLLFARTHVKAVGEQTIHCCEASRSDVCEPTDLIGRWAAGKRQ